MLLRGTELHQRKEKYGLVESTDLDHITLSNHNSRHHTDIPVVVKSKSFSYEDWMEMAKIAAKLETPSNPQ